MLPKLLLKVAGQRVSGSPHREPSLGVKQTSSVCDKAVNTSRQLCVSFDLIQ